MIGAAALVRAGLIASLFGSAAASGQQRLDAARLSPTEYTSHFHPNPGAAPHSGSRDGWESYPIAQETGYDPTINPETSPTESALVRESAPNQDGPFQLGFIRRMHLVSGPAASIRMAVRVPSATAATVLHVSIFRGEQKESHQLTVSGNAWREIVSLIAPSSKLITAIAIDADFPRAIHGRPERFLIKDVRVRALGVRRFNLVAPAALWDISRSLYYLRQAVHPGDDFSARAAVLSNDHPTWTLTSPTREQAAQGTGPDIHQHFPANATPGIWTLRLSSAHAESTALFLLRPRTKMGLLFDQPPAISASLLASIRERSDLLRKTTQPDAGMNIPAMNAQWLLPGLPSYFSIILQPSELAMLDAMEYRATGDPAARDRACRLLEAIALWPMWVHPWFPAHGYHSYYPVGIMTKYIVMAEQFLGGDLPAQDRQNLDRSLIDLAVKPIYEEYVHEDRLQFNTSNWIGNTDAGALLAALQSDAPDAAGYALGLYIKERDHVHAGYTSDGSYGEGVTYQRFDLEMTSLVAQAAKRLLGQSFDAELIKGDAYMRYAAYGKDALLDYGDSHVDIVPSNVFAYVAGQNQSAEMTGFYFRYRDEGTPELLSRVLFEASIQPAKTPPPEAPSRLFDQRGIVVLRDDWYPASTVIAMRAGKNFNHNHADEGSVFFARGGKLWLGEAGYADYYKDPAYPTFNIQAIGHNTLLVDANPDSQVIPGNAVFGLSPSFTHALMGQQASLVESDLTSAYGGKLRRYTRSLFFQQNGPLIVVDVIQASSEHIFTQVWHPKQSIAGWSRTQNRFQLTDGSMGLEVQAYAADELLTTQQPSPFPLTGYEQAEHGLVSPPVHFEISNATPRTSQTIVTLITPEGAQHPPPTWQSTPHRSTLRLADSGIQIDEPTPSHPGSIVAWWKTGALLLHGTAYQDPQTRGRISSDRPIDMQLLHTNDGVHLEIDSTEPTHLSLSRFVPSPCHEADGCQSPISLPAGHTSLLLRDSE